MIVTESVIVVSAELSVIVPDPPENSDGSNTMVSAPELPFADVMAAANDPVPLAASVVTV